MLEKLSACLVHPKLMGKYILEKTSKAVWFVVVFLLINAATIMLLSAFDNKLSQEDENTIMTTIMHDRNLELTDNKLTGTAKSYDFGVITFSFFKEVELKPSSPIRVTFNEDSYNVYLFNFKLSDRQYENLGLINFSLSDGISQADRLALNKLVNKAVNDFMPPLVIYSGFTEIINMMVTFFMMFLFLLLIGGAINPRVQGAYRVRLILLSLVSYCVVNWLYLATDSAFLYYFATLVPYIYFFIAARNIIKIEG